MKFIHLGDLHIGKSIGEFDLIEDQKYILDQILDIAEKNGIDAVLIAGDVYDKTIPSEAAVRLLTILSAGLLRRGSKHSLLPGITTLTSA